MKAGMGKALRRAFRQDDFLANVVPRKPGASSQLMNAARMSLFANSTWRPCSGLRQLARRVGVSAPVAARHLARMESTELLRTHRVGNRAAYVPLAMVEPQDAAAFAVLGDDLPRKALRQVVRGASPGQTEIATKLRTYQQEAALVMSKLVACGLLEREERGREVRYSPSVRFLAMCEAYEGRAPEFAERLMVALEGDGVSPRLTGRRGCSLAVEVDRGSERVAVAFQTNPLCEILR